MAVITDAHTVMSIKRATLLKRELNSSSVDALQLEDARGTAAAAADDAERWERRFLDERTLRRNVRRSLRPFPHICLHICHQ